MNVSVNRLSAGYGRVPVLRGVTFSAETGQIVGILGKNGMGKTTLVRSLMGYLPAMDGDVAIDGTVVNGWRVHRRVSLGVAYGPQDAALFAGLTVVQNLALAVGSRKLALQRLEELCGDFPVLGERLEQQAGSLSGGEQRMLILARALIQRPQLLVLDEISEGMQPAVTGAVARVLRREREQRGTTVLLVEQNRRLALELADRVIVLKMGEVLVDELNQGPGVKAKVEAELAL